MKALLFYSSTEYLIRINCLVDEGPRLLQEGVLGKIFSGRIGDQSNDAKRTKAIGLYYRSQSNVKWILIDQERKQLFAICLGFQPVTYPFDLRVIVFAKPSGVNLLHLFLANFASRLGLPKRR